MHVVQMRSYSSTRYHRVYDNGALACGANSYRIANRIEPDPISKTYSLDVNKLCHNCWHVNVKVVVYADSRRVFE